LLQYKIFERRKEIAKISMENRQAVVAAGVYKDPITYLNEAATKYAEIVYLNTNTDDSTAASAQSDEDLFEEWKQIFGKIEDTKSSEIES